MVTRINSASILPVVRPLETCAWCWYLLHPDSPFPEQESSTICAEHADWQMARVQAVRALRLAALVEASTVQEVRI